MAAGRFECIALRPDSKIRRSADGRTIIGGAPLRLLRLTAAGAAAAERVLSGEPVSGDADDQSIAARLVDAGIAHPEPSAAPQLSVAVVIPVRDDTRALAQLMATGALRAASGVTIVDDGSTPPIEPARFPGAAVLRHASSQGPGQARNTGWRTTDADVVVFLDADTLPPDDVIERLLRHFADPEVGVVAPRIATATTTDRVLDRYELARSPLDLGAEPALVAPGGQVTYVPTAALAVRRGVLDALGGFAPDLRVGEDVDFVWRVVDAGWLVRYDAELSVGHPPRGSFAAWLRQRVRYGSAAALLDERHPGQVAPVRLHPLSLAAWSAGVLFGPAGVAAGVAITAASVARLRAKLVGLVDDPTTEATRLAGGGTLAVGTWLARAVWRAWLPVALAVAPFSRRMRRVIVASALVPAALDWNSARPHLDLDLARFSALHAVDDAAYCTGVWMGVVRRRRLRCLLPRFIGIPGIQAKRSAAAETSPNR